MYSEEETEVELKEMQGLSLSKKLKQLLLMNNRHNIKIHALLLASLLVSGNAWAVDVKGAVYGGGNLAGVTGSTTVTLTDGTVANGVYGGCNSQGTVGGAIAVNINGGTVGASNANANVHGGGYGSATATSGDIVVTIGNGTTTPIVWGSVYGGSAFGNVNDATTDITKVWLKSGTINGDIYGGGLGQTTPTPIAAAVNGSVQVLVDGGRLTGSVYGCNNYNGGPVGTVTVDINDTDTPAEGQYSLRKVYGGGNLAAYSGTPVVTIHNCDNIIEYVYGGGNQATVQGTDVTVYGGHIGNVFGGGYGADVTQDGTNVSIYGGTIQKVYGGNDQSGSVTGPISVTIDKGTEPEHSSCAMIIDEVYGGGNLAASQAGSITIGCTGNTQTEGINYVYGGANNALVTGDIVLNISGGKIKQGLFGGNNTGNTVNGDVTVNINWDGTCNDNYLYDVFGGGNHASVSGSTTVNLLNGTISNNVYGGGKQETVRGENTTVNIANGTVGHDVFGGGLQGDVYGNVTVLIGKADGTGTVVIGHDVYGGGSFAHTNASNRSYDAQDNEVIDLDNQDAKKTIVNLYRGATIDGDAYGGGRGQQADPLDLSVTAIAAIVYGDVTLSQYGAVLLANYDALGLATKGRIFGCNNENGSPMGHVKVYVKQTSSNPSTGQIPTSSESERASSTGTHTYQLAAVYGGGNMAEYTPVGSNEFCEVYIEPDDCNDISIHSVYGGGNAAAAPATKVEVYGAYEIEYVFGGGNGAGENNKGANVGYHHYDSESDKREYGTGVATTAIYGGRIHHIYGGSNTKGNIRETAVSMLDEVSECALVVDGIYGGGREAFMEGAISLELGCITGMEELYGGSEKADVGSNVELTITSGHFGKVFGGNNKGGRIYGSITINVEQTGCVPITIDEIYLGGNNAPYSVYGYNSTETIVDFGDENQHEYVKHYGLNESGANPYPDPVLNLRSFQSIGSVYGGGKGELAQMVGNPTVDINVTNGWVNGQYVGTNSNYIAYKGTPTMLPADGVIVNNVFGGGDRAKVKGETKILIGTKMDSLVELKSMTSLYNEVGASGKTNSNILIERTTKNGEDAIVYTPVDGNGDPVSGKQPLTVTLEQTVNGATINGNIYGGGNKAAVTVGTDIQIGPKPADPTPAPAPSPAPQRSNAQPAQTNAPAQTQSPSQNVSTESDFTRTVNPNRR